MNEVSMNEVNVNQVRMNQINVNEVRQVIGRSGTQGAGPYITLVFDCEGDVVVSARFECHGCPSMMRCGDWVCKWAVGRELRFLSVLEPDDLIRVVGGLPLGKEFCARMTVDALRNVSRIL